MNTEAELTAACLANLSENTPRLVLADWLEEYGTTERQKAQVEWIRLTCHKPQRKDGVRQVGEPDWIKNNLDRLFPKLAANAKQLKLLSGRLVFSVKCPAVSVVALWGSRGIISRAEVTFLRAAVVAPWVAGDCPLTRITMTLPQEALWQISCNACSVSSHPFQRRKLLEVFRGLEGWCSEKPHNESMVRFYTTEFHKEPRTVAIKAIYDSLTRWARMKAGVPHVVLTQPDPETVDAETL